MQKNYDSVKNSKASLDSLHKALISSNNWFGLKIHDSPVQAAIIISITTIITVILGFIFKDYVIPGWIDKRIKLTENKILFIQYKSQLFKSAHSFLNRLNEIYKTRSHYLWKETPMSSFYEYKYKSSIYRLCVLLGSIRAYNLMESSIMIKKYHDEFLQISDTLKNVQSCLADGQVIEMYVVKTIFKICGINISLLKDNSVEKFSVEIDNLVQQFQINNHVEYITDLSSELQDDFINSLFKLMNDLQIPNGNLIGNKDKIIKEVSIRLALIYRDWQQAIGEIMLKKSNSNFYGVISFRDFEKRWDKYKISKNDIWLERIEKIFENLDLRVDENSDSRINQLKRVYDGVYRLMFNLYNIKIGENLISEDDFRKIPKTL